MVKPFLQTFLSYSPAQGQMQLQEYCTGGLGRATFWDEADVQSSPPTSRAGGKASSACRMLESSKSPGPGTLLQAGPPGIWAQRQALWSSCSSGDGEGERKVCGRTQVIPRTQGWHPLSELDQWLIQRRQSQLAHPDVQSQYWSSGCDWAGNWGQEDLHSMGSRIGLSTGTIGIFLKALEWGGQKEPQYQQFSVSLGYWRYYLCKQIS